MEASTFKIATREVRLQGGTLHVRGVAFEDITDLLRDHLDEINGMFALYENADDEQRKATMTKSIGFAVNLIMKAPHLASQLIHHYTAGLPLELVRMIPLPAQTEAISAILDVTFEESGGAKKYLDSLMMMMRQIRPVTKSESENPD